MMHPYGALFVLLFGIFIAVQGHLGGDASWGPGAQPTTPVKREGVGGLTDGDLFGVSVVHIGDLDGNGVVDLAVGADESVEGGAVWILFLNSDGTFKSYQKISGTEGGFTGSLEDGDRFGSSVACIDDLDGDGVADLAVGASRDDDGGDNRGAVWILFLNSDGTVKSHQKVSDTQGGFIGPLVDGDRFGSSVAYIDDLDGDGVADLAVGASRDNDGGDNRGAVWILFLNSDGTVKSHQKVSDTQGLFIPCPTLTPVVWTGPFGTPVQLPPAPIITTSLFNGNLQFQVDAPFVNDNFTWLIDFKAYSTSSDLQGSVTANRNFDPPLSWSDLWAHGPQPGAGSRTINLNTAAYPENRGDDDGVDEWRVYGTETASVPCDIVRWIGTYTLGTLTSEGVLNETSIGGTELTYEGFVHVTGISPVDPHNPAWGVHVIHFHKPFDIHLSAIVEASVDVSLPEATYELRLTIQWIWVQGGHGRRKLRVLFRTVLVGAPPPRHLVSGSVVETPPLLPPGSAVLYGPSPAMAGTQWWIMEVTFSGWGTILGEYVLLFVDDLGVSVTGSLHVLVSRSSFTLHTFGHEQWNNDFPAGRVERALYGPLSTDEVYVLCRLTYEHREGDVDRLVSLQSVEVCPESEAIVYDSETCDGATHRVSLVSNHTVEPFAHQHLNAAAQDDDGLHSYPFGFANTPGVISVGEDAIQMARDSGFSFRTTALAEREGFTNDTLQLRIAMRAGIFIDLESERQNFPREAVDSVVRAKTLEIKIPVYQEETIRQDAHGGGGSFMMGIVLSAVVLMAVILIVMSRRRRS